MKKDSLVISYTLRKLSQNKDIQPILKELNENKLLKCPISVYLPLVNKCICEIGLNPNLHDKGIDSCFELADSLLIKELIKIKILSYENNERHGWDDDTGSIYGLIINNPDFIEHYYNWTKDKDIILNYGIFSLHTFTGEAYCLDNKYIFDTNGGMFRLLKAFLKEPKHILNHKQIQDIFKNDDFKEPDPEVIHSAIYKIKKKLKMNGNLSKLFLSSGKEYLLKTI